MSSESLLGVAQELGQSCAPVEENYGNGPPHTKTCFAQPITLCPSEINRLTEAENGRAVNDEVYRIKL